MDWKVFFTTFFAIFIAELGDKTQLATFSFAAGTGSRLAVFLAASLALVCTSALGVVAAEVVQKWVSPRTLQLVSGLLFILVGLWMLLSWKSKSI
ncbi:TMEM165/GDT1 family protein [Thermodesulforhabdus norvegica]|uniref:GDT1 family protein n=1 Tax=Thermodesulforhabdus norvegica TaxID=39841 RepID=A0A1I4TSF0_9BACT|nr:TMEM165/GDT1 family protein [Thermodesulforhabdus norvegica]SFM79696.1 Uncharacterized protein family UPF0016 [Thermodesulforhabdus norvegica]